MKKNRIRICGRNTSTPPTPAMTPSTSRLRSGPSAMCAGVQSPSAGHRRPRSRPSARRPRRTPPGTSGTAAPPAAASPTPGASPARRCACGSAARAARAAPPRPGCAAPRAAVALGRGRGRAPAPRSPARRATCAWICCSSCAWPLWRTATVSTTGQPSSCASRAMSMARPCGARHVGHVQRHQHRPAQAPQLQHQAQVHAQVGGVDHGDDQVGRALRPRAGPRSPRSITCSSGVAGSRL